MTIDDGTPTVRRTFEVGIDSLNAERESFAWGMPGGYGPVVVGSSRNRGAASTLGVSTDCEAVAVWIAERGRNSVETAKSYRREAERLLLWASVIKKKSISQLYREEFLEFSEFLKAPPPDWIMKKRERREHAGWRPFLGPLSAGSQKQALTIIYSMMSYLVGVGWIVANPMPAPKASIKVAFNPTLRSLPAEFIDVVYECLKARPCNTRKDKILRFRDLWLFSLFHQMAPRVSETVGCMSSFSRAFVRGEQIWVWEVKGKGARMRTIPLTPTVIRLLSEFRREVLINFNQGKGESFPIPIMPRIDDLFPIIPSLSCLSDDGIFLGFPKSLTRNAIHKVFKGIFNEAKELARSRGIDVEGYVEASTHWLRHTSLRELADKTGDMRKVQALAGHSSINTSARYVTEDLGALQEAMSMRNHAK